MKKIILAICGGLFIHDALACTALSVKAQDGAVVAGRTMEWAYNMQWNLLFYPQGTSYTLQVPTNSKLKSTTITSRYAVLGIGTGLEQNAMLDGQNSAGLSISGNFLPGFTQYPQVDNKEHNYISLLQLSYFVLSNYATVDEVKAELPKYTIWSPKLNNLPVEPSLHFLVTDKTGKNIVIEFIDGRMKIFDQTANVMTNSPNYDWHMINIRNYVNLSNDGVLNRYTNQLGNVSAFGQGVGAIGLPGDFTPPSRFVKTTFLNYFSNKPNNANEAVNLIDHILNNVDIPIGAISSNQNGHKISDYTQWVAIKNLHNNQLIFSDYDHRTNFVTIDLDQLIKNNKQLIIPIGNISYPNNNITTQLIR
ncbi:MAG: hypothetical protein RLZZ293_1226 [Pseudomonadota bacterium]|jgi:choloylglycine hydrolase